MWWSVASFSQDFFDLKANITFFCKDSLVSVKLECWVITLFAGCAFVPNVACHASCKLWFINSSAGGRQVITCHVSSWKRFITTLVWAKTAVSANGAVVRSENCCSSGPWVYASGNMRGSGWPQKKPKRKGGKKPPHNIVFPIYKSVIGNTLVPLPVCSGAVYDICLVGTLSLQLVPEGLSNLWLVTFPALQPYVPSLRIRENVCS